MRRKKEKDSVGNVQGQAESRKASSDIVQFQI